MNISRNRLQKIVLEEYLKEEGIQLEALSQERYQDFMDWIQKNGPKPAWLDDYAKSTKSPPPPPEVPGSPVSNINTAETMPFPIAAAEPDSSSETRPMDIPSDDAPESEYSGFQDRSGPPENPEQAILGIVSAMQPDEMVDLFNNIIGQIAPEYLQEPSGNPIGFREDLTNKVYDKLLEMGGTMYRGMGAAYNRDIDTGEEYMGTTELQEEEVEDLADKFDVEATVETANDGKPAILVWHQNGDVSAYHDAEEMYRDLASRQEMNEEVIATLKNV